MHGIIVGEPYPPYNLAILVNGLSLVAMWSEPFALRGEELSYIITIAPLVHGTVKEVIVNSTNYTLTKQSEQRDCVQYQFTVYSRNGYSRSSNAVSGREVFPAGNTQFIFKIAKSHNSHHRLIILLYDIVCFFE